MKPSEVDVLLEARSYVAAHAAEDDRAREVLRGLDTVIERAICPDCKSTSAICPYGQMGCHFD